MFTNIRDDHSRQKFAALKQLHLPTDQYVITGSGPLGIRNLRPIKDIDIIVTKELWDTLAGKYEVTQENGINKIAFPGGIIDAFREGSFPDEKDPNASQTFRERIAKADIIEGLPFDSLENLVRLKKKLGREKDLEDLQLIEAYELDKERGAADK